MRFLRGGGEKHGFFAVFGIHEHQILIVIYIRIHVNTWLPRDATDVVNDVAFGEIDGLAENRHQKHQENDAQKEV